MPKKALLLTLLRNAVLVESYPGAYARDDIVEVHRLYAPLCWTGD